VFACYLLFSWFFNLAVRCAVTSMVYDFRLAAIAMQNAYLNRSRKRNVTWASIAQTIRRAGAPSSLFILLMHCIIAFVGLLYCYQRMLLPYRMSCRYCTPLQEIKQKIWIRSSVFSQTEFHLHGRRCCQWSHKHLCSSLSLQPIVGLSLHIVIENCFLCKI